MPWWITLIIELIKLLIPIFTSVKKDEKPNPVAAKEMVTKLRGVIGEAPDIKRL